MSLDSLFVLTCVLFTVLGVGAVVMLASIPVGGFLANRAYDRFASDAKDAGVDLDDDEERKVFAASSDAFARYQSRSRAVFAGFVGGALLMMMGGISGAITSGVYAHHYRDAVVNTLTVSYGVTVDSRSKRDLPEGDNSISAGLLLRLEGQAAQCTVATGYSPEALTVVCGGREIKPRN